MNKGEIRGMGDMSKEKPAYVEVMPTNLDGKKTNRMAVALVGKGCYHALRAEGGCTFCPFLERSRHGGDVVPAKIAEQLGQAMSGKNFEEEGIGELDLYIPGSFLNDEEMPPEAREMMMKAIALKPGIRRVLIESRPEFIQVDKLRELKDLLGGIRLQVGIGLETRDKRLREQVLKKGFSTEDYERALGVLSQTDTELLTYVLLKPTTMSEAAAVRESVDTIDYIQKLNKDRGVDSEVSLNPTFVAPNTPLDKLFKDGEYQPPTLWSVVEVIKRTHALGKIRVGISDEGLAGDGRVAKGCGKCDEKVRKAIVEYNKSRDLTVFDELDCECRKS